MNEQSTIQRPARDDGARRPALTALTLQLIQTWTGARAAALFVWDEERSPRLVASDAIDQGALDDAARLCSKPPSQLLQGIACRGAARREFLAIPWLVGKELRAIAYLEVAPGAIHAGRGRYLQTLAEVMALSLLYERALAGVVEWPFDQDDSVDSSTDADNLALLLEHHEWNVSRVARALRVTRMTVYNRMRRARITRRLVAKTRKRRASARTK